MAFNATFAYIEVDLGSCFATLPRLENADDNLLKNEGAFFFTAVYYTYYAYILSNTFGSVIIVFPVKCSKSSFFLANNSSFFYGLYLSLFITFLYNSSNSLPLALRLYKVKCFL